MTIASKPRSTRKRNSGAATRPAPDNDPPQPASPGPKALHIRAYQVGFGDCFLLTFEYPEAKRHVLIDFGTVRLPADAAHNQLDLIAADIKKVCGTDFLTAVVATHRHRDHISGFSTGKPGSSGEVIASLKPKHVLQPWTENPRLATDAVASTATATRTGSPDQKAMMTGAFVSSLRDMQCVAEQLRNSLSSRNFLDTPELGFLGENNLPNLSAVENLMNMADERAHEYLCGGQPTTLGDDLPGVQVHVLGPPTLQQSVAIATESKNNASEFWQLQANTLKTQCSDGAGTGKPLERAVECEGPVPLDVRWFTRKADEVRADQSLGLVRVLDKALNNTSLILLFEIAGKRFLFPGDAQLENWQYALSQPDLAKLLSGIELYKVGHHGSRNATPKSMWNQILENSGEPGLCTVVSTLPGVFGSAQAHSEVPRTTLVEELQTKSTFYSTEGQKDLAHEITFTFAG